MLVPARARFHPRTQEERERRRRDAATRAELAALAERMHTLESEQQTQLKRIAQLQAQLDEALRLLKSLTR